MQRKASKGRDPGVQPERTALAWQRTALATAAGSAIVARHTVGPLGPGALVVLAVSLGLALAAFVLGRRRYLAGPTGSRLTAADPRRPFLTTVRRSPSQPGRARGSSLCARSSPA